MWAAVLAAALASIGLFLGSALTTKDNADTVKTNLESKVGFDLLNRRLPGQDPFGSEVVIVRSAGLTVSDPTYQHFVGQLVADLQRTGAARPIPTVYSTGDPLLVSPDRRATLLPVTLTDQDHPEQGVRPLIAMVQRADHDPHFTVNITGDSTLGRDFLDVAASDLKKGELYFGLPAALIILLVVFGAAVAGLVPLVLALVCIPVTLGVAALIGQVQQLSFFVVNMVTAMGLALGIDYTLFVLSRYREQRRRAHDKVNAIAVAGGTASTAVTFSGMSFTVALLGLLLVPDTTLRSLATGAILVGLVTVAAALTLLPAVLSLLGDRVNAGRLPLVHTAVGSDETAEGRLWMRFVRVIMRTPAVSLALAGTLLVVLAVPVLGLKTGSTGVTALPDRFASKQGFAALQASFPGSGHSTPARVVIDGNLGDPAVQAMVGRLQQGLAADRQFGPTRLELHPTVHLAVVDVPLPGDPRSDMAKAALHALRHNHVAPTFHRVDAKAYVTGTTALSADYAELINRWLPIVISFVLGVTLVLLTLVFRSVVLALTAALLNLLSVGAAYGLLVLVFQHGVGASLLGLYQVESVEPWVPVFLFSVLFALSMDYQVFLLSRIRERWAATGDTTEAVAHGIGSTGRIITGAALIIIVVFAGFATGDFVGFQQMGFGVAAALLLDATIVRSIVVPSAMALLGHWNWYLPRWLSWLPELQVENTPAAAAPQPPRRPVPVGSSGR